MKLPYNRPHLFEFHDQTWCPPTISAQAQGILTFLWTHRIPPFQWRAPYEGASDVLGQFIKELEEEHDGAHVNGGLSYAEKVKRCKGKERLRIVDCCSGAGGPMPKIERRLNHQRLEASQPPIPFILSDIKPNLPSWSRATAQSSSSGLSFVPYPVDATHAPPELTREGHIRTFCLSFHHFNDNDARRIIQDALRSAEGMCIFELQEPRLESLLELIAIFPLVYLVTPFTRPSLSALILTYIIPIIPLFMLFDGFISAYRTRSLDHIQHLSNLASLALSLEGNHDTPEWKWVEGRQRHTWPSGTMYWIIGRKDGHPSP